MFQLLLRHLQGELYRKVKIIVNCLITDHKLLYTNPCIKRL